MVPSRQSDVILQAPRNSPEETSTLNPHSLQCTPKNTSQQGERDPNGYQSKVLDHWGEKPLMIDHLQVCDL